jgi:cytochrome c553
MSIRFLAALSLCALALPALAQDKAAPNVAMCEGCHGIAGYKTAFPSTYHVPLIGGQQPTYLVNALKAYKSGERSHPSMRGIAASMSEEDMKKYADYYGAQKK